jgi:photosystem II stability/assembly factor-like uncharacterized protein
MKKYIIILCVLLYVVSGCSENSISDNDNTSLTNWTLLNKTGYDICSIGNYVFCVTLNTGIHRSNDNGNTWSTANNGINLTNTENIKLFENSGILYASTTVFNSNNTSTVKYYKSINNGDTWVQIWQNLNKQPDDINIINNIIFVCAGRYIYKSIDNGTNWTESNYLGTSFHHFKIVSDGSNYFAAETSLGNTVHKSNNGSDFVELNNMNGFQEYYWPNQHCSIITIGEKIYISTDSQGVLMSNDSGISWNARNNGLTSTSGALNFVSSISCFYSNNTKLFAGSWNRVFAFNSSNESWIKLGGNLNIDDVNEHVPVFSITKNNNYYFASTGSGKIYRLSI